MHVHLERHRSGRSGWLRAAVLGADDGILSTASLMIGVTASGAARNGVLTAGTAGLTAGALAMAIGEYVSVSSQADTEAADLRRETDELAADPASELAELTRIYTRRGLSPALAAQVAAELTKGDSLAAHRRDELGQTDASLARPNQAAVASAAAFATGAMVPLVAAVVAPAGARAAVIAAAALVALIALGAAGAAAGGARLGRGALRVAIGGAIAMTITYGVGHLFGAATG
jgi:VIT1/CCC1 family predicted Fe2+/Mn2+ transporter